MRFVLGNELTSKWCAQCQRLLPASVLCDGASVTLAANNVTPMIKVPVRKLFKREKPADFWWAVLHQNKSWSGRERETQSPLGSDHCHLLSLRAGLCGGLSRTVH